jgi:cell division protein FtsI (penicillin-binding protein 3)
MEIKKDILWRVYLCFIGLGIICLFILGKAFMVQQVHGAYWRSMSDSLHQSIQEIDAERGTIYSEDGQMLSTSIPQFDIYIDFAAQGLREKSGYRFRDNIDSLSYCLANLFKDKTAEQYKKDLQRGYKRKDRYFQLKKKIGFREYQELRRFPLVRLGRNKSGFIAENRNIRLNPYQLLAFRTIGLERENSDKIGLERRYDTFLRGRTGKRLVRYMAGGVSVPVDEDDYQVEPENGKDVITTIDVHMQEVAENALMNMMLKSGSEHGCAIVMETKTGKVKAIANLGKTGDSTYFENYNYALKTSEPGSTIKLATLLSVLSEGVSIDEQITVGSAGAAYVGVRNVNDAERAPKPVMSLRECFAHSSNVGMGKIAYKTFASDPTRFQNYLHRLKLDSITGIDLDGEVKPLMPRMKKNVEGLHAMVTMAFGYAIQISPLQTLTLYNAIANGGKLVRPYLVNSIVKDGTVVKQFGPQVVTEHLVSPEVAAKARICMEAVVTEGTAKSVFKDTPYPVGGKTGTAHVADGVYGYDDGVYQASFVGYFPADKPQYTCIVVIKTKPHAALHYGGQLAAPVFKEISDRLYNLFVRNQNNVVQPVLSADSSWFSYVAAAPNVKLLMKKFGAGNADSIDEDKVLARVYREGNNVSVSPVAVNDKTMPLLNGLGLRDALALCESLGLKVNIKGKGKVAAQSVAAGTAIKKGTPVNIVLN